MTKVTKREMFEAIKAVEAVAANEAMVKFIDHEIELLAKKSSNKKPTATQIANESIKAEILAVLEDGKARTVSEIIADGNFADGTTTQKISALLTLMKNDNKVDKTIDKKRSLFSKVG